MRKVADNINDRPIAHIETMMVVRTHTPIMSGTPGQSFGQCIDRHLEEMAMAGHDVQSIELTIEEDIWKDFIKEVQKDGVDR